jgi:hypothetical protein
MSHHEVSPPTVKPANTRSRLSAGLIAALLVLGWLALYLATASPLLTAIQAGMLGLGFIGTAIVVSLWRS